MHCCLLASSSTFSSLQHFQKTGEFDSGICSGVGQGLVANIAEATNVLERLKNHALITEEHCPGENKRLEGFVHDMHTWVVSLPHSIGQPKTLETLDLSSNDSLESIPASLGNLANLSYLNLENCLELKSFPVDALLKLTKLIYLNGKGCRGMWTCHRWHHRLFKHQKCLNRTFGRLHLDGMFQALTKLEVLIIDTQLAVDLPTSMGTMAHLKHLKNQGQWGGTCDSFQGLPDILRLEGWELLLSGWDWGRLLKLRTLEVKCFWESDFRVTSTMRIGDYHHLEGLPFLTQEMLPMLTTLHLQGCQNLIGMATISQLASLKLLNISNCFSLKDLSISFLPNLETVLLDSCNEVTTINISECPSLRVVQIVDNHWLDRVAFDGKLPRLEVIILGGFGKLPDVSIVAMDAFPQLTSLQIKNYGINQLPEWFTSFTMLRTLEFCFLKNLDVIPDGVAGLPLLRKLNLEGCMKIKTLPFADSEDISFYPSLEYLSLTGTSTTPSKK
ncbi:protein SUPPRESSOR OF npr1-1, CONSTITUTIVE 1-like [Selaginella moellendorffii]|uniref:protein SUPPRESSOR OF npr1-1, CONSTITUTIVE 1-like n=1 Tax=Selaginella moellendorffii TaxID=88036 RepID=UPI000D1C4474|nr:protein SUPPRESSOR OF npr1-1, CONSTITUTIVE 1-like [Selaginella moellendorffii]|eukprot:XP_024518124.1 protein SUPPRESSOR OF npr1-1, CONSTITUTIVE 1-like [Selaginella moellendorffii]